MSYTDYSGEEIDRRGNEIYERTLRSKVETEENIGKIIAVDIESGDYAIDDDVMPANRRVFANHPHAVTWTKRIGYNAVYAVGGTLTRTAP